MKQAFFDDPIVRQMVKDLKLHGIPWASIPKSKTKPAPHITKHQINVAKKRAKRDENEDDEKERKRINRINNENQVYNADQDSKNIGRQYGIPNHSSARRYVNKHSNFLSKDVPKSLLRKIKRTQQARMSR